MTHPAQQQIEETMRQNAEALEQANAAQQRMKEKLAELNLDPVDVDRFLNGDHLPQDVQDQIQEEQQARMADLDQRKRAARLDLQAKHGPHPSAPRSWRARNRV